MTEILQAYETVILKTNVHYCVICFRTSSERRLIKPNALQNVLKYIEKSEFKITSKYQMLCYMCERQVSAASAVLRAARLSDKLHQLFQTLADNKTVADELYAYVHKWKQNKNKKKLLESQNIEEWERNLLSVRAQTTLLQTEVLMLNTGPKESDPAPPLPPGIPHNFPNPPFCTTTEDEIIQNEESAPTVCPDSLEQSVLAEPEIYMDSVVILDEDDPIEVPKEERPDTPLLFPDSPPSNIPDPLPKTNLRIRPKLANQQNITPFKITVPTSSLNFQSIVSPLLYNQLQTNSLNVPTSSLNITNNSLNLPNSSLKASNTPLNVQNMQKILINPQMMPVIQNTDKNIMLHQVVDNNGIISVPTLSAEIINGQLVIINNANALPIIQNGVNLDVVVTENQVNQKSLQDEVIILDDYTQSNKARKNNKPSQDDVVEILPDTFTQRSKKMENTQRSKKKENTQRSKKDTQRSKKNEPQNDREVKRRRQETEVTVGRRETDWEDKIPMDVISFMDATDPNADQLLRSEGPVKPLTHSMGVISDVRTVSDDHILSE